MRAVIEQPRQRLAPRLHVLRRHLGHRHHLFIHPGLVPGNPIHRQQIRHSHFGLGNAAHVAGHHRNAAQHGLQHHARSRLGPQRGRQQHARARQQHVDIIHRIEYPHIGPPAERREVFGAGAPHRHRGESGSRKRIRQRQKNRNSFHGAGINESDELIVESPQDGPIRGLQHWLQQGNRRMYRVDACVPADVVSHILAHPDHGIGGADALGFGLARKGAVRTKGKRQGGARQVHHARIRRP